MHHIKELERYPELGLSLDNLESVCTSCHNKLHREKGKGNKLERKMRMTTVIEVKANIERL
ncbi:HNH endonuclease [Paenibacillus chitinolyticus]|uniref:HNH endonuclease n=1 Tax=Paenibacillus chitinolyticus TaxID=79263 RepID=UPI00386E2990